MNRTEQIDQATADILKHMHTAELCKTGSGEHVPCGSNSQVKVDPTDPIGAEAANRIREQWTLFDDRCPLKYKNPQRWLQK